jgi:hypothetical protein
MPPKQEELSHKDRRVQKTLAIETKKAAKKSAQESRKKTVIAHWTGFSDAIVSLVLEFAAFTGKVTADSPTVDDLFDDIFPVQTVDITWTNIMVMQEPTKLIPDPKNSNKAVFLVFSPFTVKGPDTRARDFLIKQGLSDKWALGDKGDNFECLLLSDGCTVFTRPGSMEARVGLCRSYELRARVKGQALPFAL